MADEKVRKVQQWLNSNYSLGVDEDGYTGNKTVTALIKALQTELGLSADGSFGPGTVSKFNQVFPNGLNVETNPTSQSTKNIIYILRGGMYCRGINGGDIDTDDAYKFDTALSNDIKFMKELLGIDNPTDLTTAIEIKAVLTTDAYTKVSNGDEKVREIQQALNKKYLSIIGSYLATNGLYERYTNIALKKAVQYEIGVTPDGSWGDGTKSKLPALSKGSTKKNLIYLAQYLLFLNGFDPNGFDGSFGNGATNATKNFQTLMHLTVDGSIGPQTWFALVLSCGDTSRSANACDTRFEITPARAQVLKNNGYQVVGRYINGGDFKELRENELSVIFNAGLKAFFIYQESNRNISDFSYEKGVAVGGKASAKAKEHKLLHDSVIYFAVDLDVYENQIDDYIVPYFRGIASSLDSNYKIGIYGPRLVCQRVSDRNLAVSSFVADMSSGFSCNIGQKIPSNWCYDQFREISNFNGDFDIDKVTYNGKIPACSSLQSENTSTQKNENTYNLLNDLYNHADTYLTEIKHDTSTVYKRNILVLQFFRDLYYDTDGWNDLIGYVDNNWVNYALEKTNMSSGDRDTNVKIKISNTTEIGLIHLSAVLEGLLDLNRRAGSTTSNSIDSFAANQDLMGWAGDLLSMAASVAGAYDHATIPPTEVIMSYIGDTTSEIHTFPFEDLIQDVDALNMYIDLVNTPINSVFKNYYNKLQYDRYNTFYDKLKSRTTLSHNTIYQFWYDLSYAYIRKNNLTISGLISTLFNSIIIHDYNYDGKKWADPICTAFATKMCYLQGKSTTDTN